MTEFIDDMAAAYARADVIARRSGTLTVSEIAAAGLLALFVSFQHKDRQQYWNALPLGKAGVARVIRRSQLSVNVVVNTLVGWSREILLTVAERAHIASTPDATERVANEVSRTARAQLQRCLLYRTNLRS